jgi:hypothetical protein
MTIICEQGNTFFTEHYNCRVNYFLEPTQADVTV